MKLILLLTMIFAGTAFAASTGTLLLKGSVPKVVSIVVTPNVIASTLPLQTTQSQTIVATTTEKWNTLGGVKVKIQSANLAKLKHQTVTTSVVNYTLRYRNTNLTTLNTAAGQTFNVTTAGLKNVTNNVQLSYTGIPLANLIEGDYTDTLTFTISAN